MGEIIRFGNKGANTDEISTPREKKMSVKKWLTLIVTIITTFCTVTGITIYTLVEKEWQKIAEKYNNDGLELYNLGKYEESIEAYDKAIELESKGIDDIEVCYYNRGRAYFKMGNYQKAIGDYTMAIEISPKSKYYSDRAVTYEKIGENEKAALDNIKALTAIIE